MLSKTFLAKCADRSQMPKAHPSGITPDSWFANEVLIPNGLFGISFDFFVNWSSVPVSITPTIWIKRLVNDGHSYHDVTNDLDRVMNAEFGVKYLNRLTDFAIGHQLHLQFLLFKDQANWAKEDSTVLMITVCKDEHDQLHFSHTEVTIVEFKKIIQRNSGGPVQMGTKGLIYGTSCLECLLSHTDSLYPGDVDLLLLDENNIPKAVVEFKKHTLLTSIDDEQLSKYYPRPDARKYERLAILRDYLCVINAHKMKLPILVVYHPTQPESSVGRLELIEGEPGKLKALAASNFKLPADHSSAQILPVVYKTMKAIKWYNENGSVAYKTKRYQVDQKLIALVEDYLATHNLANRGVEDGDYARQRIGLIGELMVYKYLYHHYPDLNLKQDGFDGGYDIAYNNRLIDVKTMGRKSFVRPDFVNNFYLLQSHHQADTVVFCSFHSGESVLEICGWLPKEELATRGIYYAAGTQRLRTDGSSFTFRQHNYEVKNIDLDDIETIRSKLS